MSSDEEEEIKVENKWISYDGPKIKNHFSEKLKSGNKTGSPLIIHKGKSEE